GSHCARFPVETSDRVGRRRFPRSTGPRGKQSRQCNGQSALGSGTCSPSFDLSAVFARSAFPPRSCYAVKYGRAHVRRRRDMSSSRDLRGAKHHPHPTLPHRGGGLQEEGLGGVTRPSSLVRSASRGDKASCWPPSISTIRRAWWHTKSAM